MHDTGRRCGVAAAKEVKWRGEGGGTGACVSSANAPIAYICPSIDINLDISERIKFRYWRCSLHRRKYRSMMTSDDPPRRLCKSGSPTRWEGGEGQR